MKYFLLFSLFIFGICFHAHAQVEILTEDIDNFWKAYDKLPDCKTKEDSIAAFQQYYIDAATEGLIAFIKVRDFDAPEYYQIVKKFPKFWASIRPKTEQIKEMRPEIEKIYEDYARTYPGHKAPKICFAIGTLRTGGTTSREFMLIGTEIVTADKEVDKSELNKWLQSVMKDEAEVEGIVAHEYIHTQQRLGFGGIWAALNHRLLFMSLMEGSCDFLAIQVTGASINQQIIEYGEAHEAELWQTFEKEMYRNKYDQWMYQGNNTPEGVPADLGYFMGYKISQAYYEQAEDKEQALRDILRIKNYKRFLKKSGYAEKVKRKYSQTSP
ncbi:MAG: DUF2268 domain-containing putative Zn-dependent protease [Bacteroidota bacterium]